MDRKCVELFTPKFVCSVCGRQRSLHWSVFRNESVEERNKPKHTASMDNTTSQSTEKHEWASWQREKGGHDEGLMETVRENRELHWKRSVAFSAGSCHTDLWRKWSSNVGSRARQELHLLLNKAVRMHFFFVAENGKCWAQRRHDEGCEMPQQKDEHKTRGEGCEMLWKPQIIWICSCAFWAGLFISHRLAPGPPHMHTPTHIYNITPNPFTLWWQKNRIFNPS